MLHAVDPEGDTATFLEVAEARLRSAGFLDGRTALSDRPPETVAGLAAAADASKGEHAVRRYIFHGAFCGSTLLGRLLDHPGRTLVLREPHVLADLAGRKQDAAKRDPRLQDWCDLAAASLFHPRRAGETVVVKPSNWANTLLPELCGTGAGVRAVFIEATLPEFLAAAFRGGGERLTFIARAVEGLSRGDAADEALVAQAQRDGANAFQEAANVAAALHVLQRRRFTAARARAGWTQAQVIRRDLLASDPLAAARRADASLELDLPDDLLSSATLAWSGRYAKDSSIRYVPSNHAAADREVQARFGDDLRAACAWAERMGFAAD